MISMLTSFTPLLRTPMIRPRVNYRECEERKRWDLAVMPVMDAVGARLSVVVV